MTGERSPRGRPPSEEKRSAVLEAATEIFLERGFGAASMDAVAQRAGVSKATVYKHFGGKEQLFGAIVEARCRELLIPLVTPEIRENDPRSTLQAIAGRFMDLILDDRALAFYRVVIAQSVRFPELARAFYENGPGRAIESLAEYLAEENARGRLAVSDPVCAAEQFFSLLSGYVHVRALLGMDGRRRAPDLGRHIAAAVETFLRVYAPAPGA